MRKREVMHVGCSPSLSLYLWQASLINFSIPFLGGWQRHIILFKGALQAELIQEVKHTRYFRLRKYQEIFRQKVISYFSLLDEHIFQLILKMVLTILNATMKLKCFPPTLVLASPWRSSWFLQSALLFSFLVVNGP